MPSQVFFKTDGSTSPEAIMDRMAKGLQPTVGDLLYAGQRQRSRILLRTQRGVDVNGSPFAPYSTNGPYYWNPTASRKGLGDKERKQSVSRLMKKLAVDNGLIKSRVLQGTGAKKGGGRFVRTKSPGSFKGKMGHVTVSRSGHTIKFESYAAFKYYLGRTNVDLRGPKAPHMLQALVVRVKNFLIGQGSGNGSDGAFMPLDSGGGEPADEIRLGIYGPEAARADGHQQGNPGVGLPQRRFLGASYEDRTLMLKDIVSRILFRIGKGVK